MEEMKEEVKEEKSNMEGAVAGEIDDDILFSDQIL